jgi:hypothetical protein
MSEAPSLSTRAGGREILSPLCALLTYSPKLAKKIPKDTPFG